MLEAFRGWRPKAGLVLLGVALSIAGLWLHSGHYRHQLAFPAFNHNCALMLTYRGITCLGWTIEQKPFRLAWETIAIPQQSPGPYERDSSRLNWYFWRRREPSFEWSCPYWPIILMITYNSACLLFWNPRRIPREIE